MTHTEGDIVMFGTQKEATNFVVSTDGKLCYHVDGKEARIQLPFPCSIVGIHSKEKPLKLIKQWQSVHTDVDELISKAGMYLTNPYGEKDPDKVPDDVPGFVGMRLLYNKWRSPI